MFDDGAAIRDVCREGGTMTKHRKAVAVCLGLAMALLFGTICAAQQKKPKDSGPTPAPIPAQIITAKKVFIANGGGDKSGYDGATLQRRAGSRVQRILCGYESLGALRTGWVTGRSGSGL